MEAEASTDITEIGQKIRDCVAASVKCAKAATCALKHALPEDLLIPCSTQECVVSFFCLEALSRGFYLKVNAVIMIDRPTEICSIC